MAPSGPERHFPARRQPTAIGAEPDGRMTHAHLFWALLFAFPAWTIWRNNPERWRDPLIYLVLSFGAIIVTWIIESSQAPY